MYWLLLCHSLGCWTMQTRLSCCACTAVATAVPPPLMKQLADTEDSKAVSNNFAHLNSQPPSLSKSTAPWAALTHQHRQHSSIGELSHPLSRSAGTPRCKHTTTKMMAFVMHGGCAKSDSHSRLTPLLWCCLNTKGCLCDEKRSHCNYPQLQTLS